MCAAESTSVPVAAGLQKPYSEDEPPPKDQEVAKFKWRLDPVETFSDWKIEIVTPGKDTTGDEEDGQNEEKKEPEAETVKTYYVHKCHLAVGARRSEYFARLFQSPDKFKESEDCTSRIDLDPLAASAFPCLLDYVYAPDRPLEISTETATALHQLGEYFEIRHLRWDAKQFCLGDISLDNVDTYYQHATLFQNETIIEILAEFLGKSIKEVPLSSQIVKETDPQLWVKASKAVDPTHTNHWSEVVCKVGHIHMNDLDTTTFDDLTEASFMPKVDAKIALDYCELEDRLEAQCESSESPDLTSLQERCATSLSEIWQELESYDHDILTNLKRRKASFLVDLLLKCLQVSRCELREANLKLQKANDVVKKFKPLKQGDYICAGAAKVPKDIADLNPNVARDACQQHQHDFNPIGHAQLQYCPVFYYADLP